MSARAGFCIDSLRDCCFVDSNDLMAAGMKFALTFVLSKNLFDTSDFTSFVLTILACALLRLL